MKIDDFGEKFITRESICGHFYPGGLGWGGIWGRFFEKMLVWGGWVGKVWCWNQGGVGKLRFCGHLEKVQERKWRWRTLDILCDRFWNYFWTFRGNCKENGCGLGFLRILFLYRIQPPIFPRGVALFFHVALFLTLDHPPSVADIIWTLTGYHGTPIKDFHQSG